MKIIKWGTQNILLLITLFLLAFIPLYPKLPLIDIKNTWVYIRIEDLIIVASLLVWFIQLLRGKVSLKTPLTLPIIIFWLIGAIATMHAVIIIFPAISNVFYNVAFLSYLRRIEYISLFFIAYAAMRDKRNIFFVVAVLVITLLLVVAYGVGQRYLGFPAYLTMNEEFAKGIPIKLSSASRVPSTFGGHYDLAAYLVLVIPIFASLIFGFRKWFIKLLLFAVIALGVVLLFMTVSRVSVLVMLASLAMVFFFHKASISNILRGKKKLVIFSLPITATILVFLTLNFSQSLLARFGNTIRETNVLVDTTTGEAIGHVKKIPSNHFKDKIIVQMGFRSKDDLFKKEKELAQATSSARVPFLLLPEEVVVAVPPNTPTGENLPQGTGYINLTLSPVTQRLGDFFYLPKNSSAYRSESPEVGESTYVARFTGDFLVKRAAAYDLSFTTRFQGEWPNAIAAFKRNILFGSGYSSISLAVDNNFLRILGETGLLGFISFFSIFVIAGIYIVKTLPEVSSPVVKSFVLGFIAGILGLMLNSIFIDVFEASKVAYPVWLLMGVSLGALSLSQTKYIALFREFKNVITSQYAIAVYICVIAVLMFYSLLRNFFVGDDFTWLRWANDCSVSEVASCPTFGQKIVHYVSSADGFFYRPGTKVYFALMYSIFWLNQGVYHIVSIILHIIVTVLVFLLARKVLRDALVSSLAAFLFLILSGHSEAVFWISSTGYLINAMLILLSLLFIIAWEEKKKTIYYIASFISLAFSLLFHELGIITPLLIVLYILISRGSFEVVKIFKNVRYVLLFSPIPIYILVRYFADSHWFGGDYSYNLLKLPFNLVGNLIGYFMLALLGPISLPFYNLLRNILRGHILVVAVVFLIVLALVVLTRRIIVRDVKLLMTKLRGEERRLVIVGILFFIITLLPFLGLGNIASRYSYLASAGFILLFVLFIKKLYGYLLSNGKEVAFGAVATLLALFSLLHIFQLQQAHGDWFEAGERVKRFFISIDGLYRDYWSREHMEFHFVNVPIRTGEAWVFPVGIKDALWFVFRNSDINVYQWSSVEQAIAAVDGSPNQKVFVFDKSGNVTEVIKTKQLFK